MLCLICHRFDMLSVPACNGSETFAAAKVRKKSDICKKDVKIFVERGEENEKFKGKAAYKYATHRRYKRHGMPS